MAYTRWFNLAILCCLNLGVRNLSFEFPCNTAMYTSTAVSSFPSPEESTHLLWHRLLELSGSSRSLPAEWGQALKTLLSLMFLRDASHPCACRRQLKHLEGSWMKQAYTQSQQTRSTEHATLLVATLKAAQLSTSMLGLCYISIGLNCQETPGQNARKCVFGEWITCLIAKRE